MFRLARRDVPLGTDDGKGHHDEEGRCSRSRGSARDWLRQPGHGRSTTRATWLRRPTREPGRRRRKRPVGLRRSAGQPGRLTSPARHLSRARSQPKEHSLSEPTHLRTSQEADQVAQMKAPPAGLCRGPRAVLGDDAPSTVRIERRKRSVDRDLNMTAAALLGPGFDCRC